MSPPLTQSEVDSILVELAQKTATDEEKKEFGVGVLKALIEARPESKDLLVKLRGVEDVNSSSSEDIEHYGEWLREKILELLNVAGDESGLNSLLKEQGTRYSSVGLIGDELKACESIVSEYLQQFFSDDVNRANIQKLFDHSITLILSHL
ncbi:unnamed protein product [Calicophoron daubneyi]|uniref:Uncharacterized protein n=1 Tax=Calicophoron daubneyi TaxID=300641 RepID=A0AAV2TGZ9_CALDB